MGQNATRITPPVVFVAGEAIEPSCQKRPSRTTRMLAPLASRTSIAIYIAKTEKPKFSRRYFGCLKAKCEDLLSISSYGELLGEATL